MSRLFKVNTTPEKKTATVTINIPEDFVDNILKPIFEEKITYYSERQNEVLTEKERETIFNNAVSQYVYNLQKISTSSIIDLFTVKKLTFNLIFKPQIDSYTFHTSLNPIGRWKTQLKEPTYQRLIDDWGVVVKYCVIGQINIKKGVYKAHYE